MEQRKRGAMFFPAFLGLVFLLFMGLLAYTWYGAKQADPVILDEKGRPRGASSAARP